MARSRADARRTRTSFDRVAALYDRYRDPPPEVVLRHAIEVAALGPESRVLEVGGGTGQLSLPLARLGLDLTVVEMGPHLARIARDKLRAFPRARVHVAAFESWTPPPAPFDAVVSCNAFHWLDPAVRLVRSGDVLLPGGILGIIHPHHVRGGTPGFVRRTQPLYMEWGLSDDPEFMPPTPSELSPIYPEIDIDGRFTDVHRQRFPVLRAYTTDAYVGLLQTDSLILGMESEADRQGFLSDIRALIDGEFEGRVVRQYVYEVVTGRRTEPPSEKTAGPVAARQDGAASRPSGSLM